MFACNSVAAILGVMYIDAVCFVVCVVGFG